MIMDRTRFACTTVAAVGAGTAVFFYWWWWTRRSKEQPPSKWRKVGELADLMVFPVKSMGPVRLAEMECTLLGLKSGWLRDRTLMVVDLTGRFVTGQQYPKLVQVSPSVSDSILTLRAPGMTPVSVDLSRLRWAGTRALVWGQNVPACDCGEEAAKWLSQFLLQEDASLRLVYYPLERPTRVVSEKNKAFPFTIDADTGAYPDETSFSLINESSVSELNARLDEPITALHFRMNFIVNGATAYEEDTWDWVKIGDVVMRNVRPCTRCVRTTIDPETAAKDPKVEPLKTLKTYRQISDPALRRAIRDSPVMGIHLGLKGPNGIVRVGDPVYVGVPDENTPSLNSPP